MVIQYRETSDEKAIQKLKEIFDQLQEDFHDQWDWMNAYYNVEVLRCVIEDLKGNVNDDSVNRYVHVIQQPDTNEVMVSYYRGARCLGHYVHDTSGVSSVLNMYARINSWVKDGIYLEGA